MTSKIHEQDIFITIFTPENWRLSLCSFDSLLIVVDSKKVFEELYISTRVLPEDVDSVVRSVVYFDVY